MKILTFITLLSLLSLGPCAFADDFVIPMGMTVDAVTETGVTLSSVTQNFLPIKVTFDANSELAACSSIAEVMPDHTVHRLHIRLGSILCSGGRQGEFWKIEGYVSGYGVERGNKELGLPFEASDTGEIYLPKGSKMAFVFIETETLPREIIKNSNP